MHTIPAFHPWASLLFSATDSSGCNRVNVVLLLAALVGVFMFPHTDSDWMAELALTIVAFPLIISLAAGTTVMGRLRDFCVSIGRLSYPLCMSHICIVWSFGNYFNAGKPEGWQCGCWWHV